MDFTREPIVETVITPKEGYKIVVRSSKGVSQEEYFVDAVEMVSFGNYLFYRSREKPKSFLAPVGDYEVLEVRETRLVLKHVSGESSAKVSGRTTYEAEKVEERGAAAREVQVEKKRERRKHSRRRRRDETKKDEETTKESITGQEAPTQVSEPSATPATLLPPPMQLISETLDVYKKNEEFRGAFYMPDEGEIEEEVSTTLEQGVTDISMLSEEGPTPFEQELEQDTLAEEPPPPEPPQSEESSQPEEETPPPVPTEEENINQEEETPK